MRICVISGGLSHPSTTRALADQIAESLRQHVPSGVDAHTVDLKDHAPALLAMLTDGAHAPEAATITTAIDAAEAVVIATPIHNMGMSALVKMLVDATDPGLWRDKPVLLAATAGSVRHSLAVDYAVRPIITYLRARVAPTAVFATSAEVVTCGHAADSAEARAVRQRIDQATAELVQLANSPQ